MSDATTLLNRYETSPVSFKQLMKIYKFIDDIETEAGKRSIKIGLDLYKQLNPDQKNIYTTSQGIQYVITKTEDGYDYELLEDFNNRMLQIHLPSQEDVEKETKEIWEITKKTIDDKIRQEYSDVVLDFIESLEELEEKNPEQLMDLIKKYYEIDNDDFFQEISSLNINSFQEMVCMYNRSLEQQTTLEESIATSQNRDNELEISTEAHNTSGPYTMKMEYENDYLVIDIKFFKTQGILAVGRPPLYICNNAPIVLELKEFLITNNVECDIDPNGIVHSVKGRIPKEIVEAFGKQSVITILDRYQEKLNRLKPLIMDLMREKLQPVVELHLNQFKLQIPCLFLTEIFDETALLNFKEIILKELVNIEYLYNEVCLRLIYNNFDHNFQLYGLTSDIGHFIENFMASRTITNINDYVNYIIEHFKSVFINEYSIDPAFTTSFMSEEQKGIEKIKSTIKSAIHEEIEKIDFHCEKIKQIREQFLNGIINRQEINIQYQQLFDRIYNENKLILSKAIESIKTTCPEIEAFTIIVTSNSKRPPQKTTWIVYDFKQDREPVVVSKVHETKPENFKFKIIYKTKEKPRLAI